jgi:hypothetical protein
MKGRKLNRQAAPGVTTALEDGMKSTGIVLLAVAAAGLVWIGVSAQQQEMLPRPGPGSGVVDVRGTVSLAGVSEVRLSDVPDVNIVNMPAVRIAEVPPVKIDGPSFVKPGGRYLVTWAAGEQETITVTAVAQGGGWVQAGTSRWINLDHARAVEEAR